MAKTYLIPISYIKTYTVIDENVDDKFINVATIDAQEQLLEPVIGTVLYEKLLNDTANSVLTADYQDLIVNKIWPFLMQCIMYKIVTSLIYRVTNSSVVKDSNDISSSISLQELNVIRQERQNSMRYHQDKLIKYLEANTNKYPEYYSPSTDGNDATGVWQPLNFYSDEIE